MTTIITETSAVVVVVVDVLVTLVVVVAAASHVIHLRGYQRNSSSRNSRRGIQEAEEGEVERTMTRDDGATVAPRLLSDGGP